MDDSWRKLRRMLDQAQTPYPLRRDRRALIRRVLAVAASLLLILSAGWYLWTDPDPAEAYTATMVDLDDTNGIYYADYLHAAHSLFGYIPVSEGSAGGQLLVPPPTSPLENDSMSGH